MSLEEAVRQNTAAINNLIGVWTTLTAQAKNIQTDVKNGEVNAISMGGAIRVEVAPPKPAPTPPAAEIAPVKPEAATAPPSEVTFEQVTKAITEAAKTDKPRVIAVLAEFGAKRGTDLKAEQYAGFVEALSQVAVA